MQRLKKRPRLDTLVSQQRAQPAKAWGRWLYSALLASCGLAVLYYLVGDAFILRADGLVIADRRSIAATFPARVSEVLVSEGASVGAGDVIMRLESADMLRDIAELATRAGELAVRKGQLASRRATAQVLLPLARRHAEQSRGQIARIDSIAAKGIVSSQRLDEALVSEYDAASRLAELDGQVALIDDELALVERSHDRAEAALAQLEAFYDGGAVRAPSDGVIGARIPVLGQVARFGDELMQVNGKRTHVLAYLPDAYLFKVAPGDAVSVRAGSSTAKGRVEAILDVADALPAEFQNMFRPRDRSRLMKVGLEDDASFALSQKVTVSVCLPVWCERGARAGAAALGSTGEH